MSKKNLWYIAASLVAAIVTACLHLALSPVQADFSSPEGLVSTLAKMDLPYESRAFSAGSETTEPGTYLRRAGDTRPWEELASQDHVAHPERWRGYVRVRLVPPTVDTTESAHCRRLGNVLLVGDPEEIARIIESLR